jgi:signal transduction histidine kinase
MVSRSRLLRRFADLPIRRKLTMLMALSSSVGLILSGIALIGYAWSSARAATIRDLHSVSQISADSTAAALLFGDVEAARELLSALRSKPEVDSACLYTDAGDRPTLFAEYVRETAARCGETSMRPGVHEQLGGLGLVREVTQNGDRIGWLQVRINLQPLTHTLTVQIGLTITILAASFAVSLGIAWLMQPALAGPILDLATVARRISESGDYSLRARRIGADEVGRLVDDFNLMLDQIAIRDRDIETARDALSQQVSEKTAANHELLEALDRLQQTQAQLVQSERLASLGGLVAGVAHEINTPVGVGVTAASTLQDRARDIEQAYRNDTLRRSDLERFVDVARESSNIILRNLQRAADLIQSFKQVAVDQSSGERRRFDLHSYIDEVLLSLAPRTKKSGHRIVVECPDDLQVDSYPGALAQVLTNFVSNSLLHAFPDGRIGELRITAEQRGDWIELRYSDNGAGIAQENLKRIYDPFFTTKRGSGGSGLGLHIVYNLIQQILGGTIEVASEIGAGTRFTVRFPAQLKSKT